MRTAELTDGQTTDSQTDNPRT